MKLTVRDAYFFVGGLALMLASFLLYPNRIGTVLFWIGCLMMAYVGYHAMVAFLGKPGEDPTEK
jgi:lipopolysaccharide export LptBFGC system permease protein LptF